MQGDICYLYGGANTSFVRTAERRSKQTPVMARRHMKSIFIASQLVNLRPIPLPPTCAHDPFPHPAAQKSLVETTDPVSVQSEDASLSGPKGQNARAFRSTPLRGDFSTLRFEDVALSWGARKGAAMALVGLGRGTEALAEVAVAMEFANQVCPTIISVIQNTIPPMPIPGARCSRLHISTYLRFTDVGGCHPRRERRLSWPYLAKCS